MSIVQAILLGVLYWIGEANLPFVGLWTVQRPLVCGWIAGIILGDALTGAMVGASINLVYLGFISAGGSMPADMALAGTLGAAFGCRYSSCTGCSNRSSGYTGMVLPYDL